jgi:hypothetical protein
MGKTKHSDSSIYVVWVLWLIGMSEKKIGLVASKGGKQVAGIVSRSPYANRSAMSDDQRQKALDELASVRIGEDGKKMDGGILDRIPMKIIPLQGRQLKRSK